MKNHISKRAISFKIAILAIAVAVATMVGLGIITSNQSNAFGSNENNTVKVTYSATSEADIHTVSYEAENDWHSSEPVATNESGTWEIGDDVLEAFADGHEVESIDYIKVMESNSLKLTLKDSNNLIKEVHFKLDTMTSYDWKRYDVGNNAYSGVSSSAPGQIDPKSGKGYRFIYTNKDEPSNISIKGKVVSTENMASPLEGAGVYYARDTEPDVSISQDTTKADGTFELKNIPLYFTPGFITADCSGYFENYFPISYDDVEESERTSTPYDMGEITLAPEYSFQLFGGEHHVIFEIDAVFIAEGQTLPMHFEFKEITAEDDLNIPDGAEYFVNEKGQMEIDHDNIGEEEGQMHMTFTPVCDEGYIVDKWSFNGVDLVVGQVSRFDANEDIYGYVSYKPAQEVNITENATAQTGDAMPIAAVVFAVIALFGGAVLLRKSFM